MSDRGGEGGRPDLGVVSPRFPAHAQTVTLYYVPPIDPLETQILSESLSISAGGVGADGLTTYVEVAVESYDALEEPGTTNTVMRHVTFVENASGVYQSAPVEMCADGACTADTTDPPAVQTCAFGADGHGTCLEKVFRPFGTQTLTYSGAVMPFYTLATATSAPQSNHAVPKLVPFTPLVAIFSAVVLRVLVCI
ncbi:hypothetical protein C8F04DRAFT_1273806 [Mycena alexandri]|uniref:Uncharacterized protein n=1 Tax=Mycena alexandri TaxID=1745969 RepID=A0AAD6S590_9AGAR|nr:hypothetical protein C8F04DRAFT_1273806 [Mycena alexandri]